MPHYITTENTPPEEIPRDRCKAYFFYIGWQLDQFISTQSVDLIIIQGRSYGDSEIGLPFVRWRRFDRRREKMRKKDIKKHTKKKKCSMKDRTCVLM